jgi:putative ABC transport system permease protein
VHNLLLDFRLAARLIRKSPWFAFMVALTLGLGIGVNTATFSVARHFLLEPLALPHLDRLVMVLEHRANRPSFEWDRVSPANFYDWQAQSRSFEQFAAFQANNVNLTGDRDPEQLQCASVTPNFFATLGAHPQLGRTFGADEARDGEQPVAVLGYRLWQRRFGADADIVGKPIKLNGKDFTVIGVMRQDFRFPLAADIWTPLTTTPAQRADRASHLLQGVARLKPGVTVEQAAVEMGLIAKRLSAAYPSTNQGWDAFVQPTAEFVTGYYTRNYTILMMAACLCVLLIACVNVANLQFARASGRLKEFAIRTALGAGRVRLLRQILTESVLLALLGGMVGLAFGAWGIDLIVAAMPPEIARFLPGWDAVSLDRQTLLFSLALAVLAGLVAGTAPAWRSARADVNENLKEGGRGSSSNASSQRLRSVLVICEIAMSLVLLVGAGLMVKGTRALTRLDSELHPETVLTMWLTLPESKYPEAHHKSTFYDGLLRELDSVPQTSGAALATTLPLSGSWTTSYTLEGVPDTQVNEYRVSQIQTISPSFFRVLQVPLLEGREFTGSDGPDARNVAIINRTMARRHWPGQNPIGRRLKLARRADAAEPWLTVVGVVGDVHYEWGNFNELLPTVYRPYKQTPQSAAAVILRFPGDPMAAASAVRQAVAKVDRDQPVFEVLTLEQVIRQSLIGLSYVAWILTITGVIALVLSCVGVYGLMAYAVAERTHEIGIRIALGADPAAVLGLVARRGLLLTGIGLTIGLAGAFATSRALSGLIFGVSSSDVSIFGGVSLVLLAVALVACYAPVRRALRVDPVDALRSE